jgi:hypothetical protein
MSAPRVLFRCPGRRGLGHIVRALNIAREIRAVDAAAQVAIYTRGAAGAWLIGDELPHVVEDAAGGTPRWLEALERFAPDVIVDDTALRESDGAVPPGVRRVFVMRRAKDERHDALLAGGALDDVDLVLVPHTEEEFGLDVGAGLRARTVFTGPIVRRPSAGGAQAARARHGVPDGGFLLVSTAGGGGFDASAARLFATAAAAQGLLAGRLAGLRHVLVRGPNATVDAPPRAGLVVLDADPAMVDLIAGADLVLAEAGYNTINEIRLAGTPAVLLPGDRAWDDQHARAHELQARGSAVVAGGEPEQAARTVAGVALDRDRLAALRAAAAGDVVPIGNRTAAEAILACVR